jgi:Cu+-exporting ATPase
MAALLVDKMHCASCVANVDRAARSVPGLRDIHVDLANGRAVVDIGLGGNITDVADAISEAGFPAKVVEGDASLLDRAKASSERRNQSRLDAEAWKRRAIFGLCLWVPAESLHWGGMLFGGEHHGLTWMTWVGVVAGTLVLLVIGRAFFASAWRALRRGTTNMDTLISLGGGTAFFYSTVALLGHLVLDWPLADLYFAESAALFTLISLGHWLEARARDKTGDAIHALLDLAPPTALRLPPQAEATKRPAKRSIALGVRDAPSEPEVAPSEPEVAPSEPEVAPLEPEEVPASLLRVGDRVVIKPATKVPADGTVESGRGGIDESMLTGEPMPVAKQPGDPVVGGSVNKEGSLVVRVTATGADSTLAGIVRMVETAQASRPPVQRLADRISAIFVPAVLGIATLTAAIWLITGFTSDKPTPQVWGDAARATCSVLIIACPCALGLAVPAAIMVGTGRGARRGILLRDIDAIQNAAKIDTIVFDKTGTLTTGKPRVMTVAPAMPEAVGSDDLLRLAASVEQASEHPLGQAVVQAAKDADLQLTHVSDFKSHPGLGVEGRVDGQRVVIGSRRFVDSQLDQTPRDDADLASMLAIYGNAKPGDDFQPHQSAGTLAFVGLGKVIVGYIELQDELRPEAAAVVRELQHRGLDLQLLTGDRRVTGEAVGESLGIDTVHADVRPGEKQAVIQRLRDEGKRVAMVGDGVNDAPALAAADVGIALSGGTDAAKEAGHIVLVGDRLSDVPTALGLSRSTMRVVKQNLFLAFIYNVVAIPIAAAGLLNPAIAAGAMALSDVSVLGNALRLKRAKIG